MQEIADDGLTLQVHRRLRADLLGGRIAPGAKLKVQVRFLGNAVVKRKSAKAHFVNVG